MQRLGTAVFLEGPRAQLTAKWSFLFSGWSVSSYFSEQDYKGLLPLFLPLGTSPGILRWEIFFWSLKPLAHTLQQMFCILGFTLSAFPHWRRYSQLLLFAFEVNLQRAFCSVSLPGKWRRHCHGMLCEDEPLSLPFLPFPSTQSAVLPDLSPFQGPAFPHLWMTVRTSSLHCS